MADFVKYELDDGSEVFFEASEGSGLVSLRGGVVDVADGGRLRDRLRAVAGVAEEVSGGLRDRLAVDELELEFCVSVSAEVNWWFVSRTRGDGSLSVRLRWRRGESDPAEDG